MLKLVVSVFTEFINNTGKENYMKTFVVHSRKRQKWKIFNKH